MRTLILFLLATGSLSAQPPAGLGTGYLGELEHIGRQIVQLAEAVPEEKYTWRPAPGVMSVAEVYLHVYTGSFGLLSQAGHKQPQSNCKTFDHDSRSSRFTKWQGATFLVG